jgi:hypothetical protein
MNCVLIDKTNWRFVKAAPTVQQLIYWAELLLPQTDYIAMNHERKPFSSLTAEELKAVIRNSESPFKGYTTSETDYGELINMAWGVGQNLPCDDTPLHTLIDRVGHRLECATPGARYVVGLGRRYLLAPRPPKLPTMARVNIAPPAPPPIPVPPIPTRPPVTMPPPIPAIPPPIPRAPPPIPVAPPPIPVPPPIPQAARPAFTAPKPGTAARAVWDTADALWPQMKGDVKAFRKEVCRYAALSVNESSANVYVGKWLAAKGIKG